jgi:hypothetical protein
MTSLTPGSLVEAIETHSALGYAITKGRIYVCEDVVDGRRLRGCTGHGAECRGDGITLREAQTPLGFFWCAASFRPVGEPASDFIAQAYVSNWLGEPLAA